MCSALAHVCFVPKATIRGTRCVQSRFFLAELRDAFFLLAFFFERSALLKSHFFRDLFLRAGTGLLAPIAVATLSHTAPGAAVAVAAAAAAAWATGQLELWLLRRRFSLRLQQFLAHAF